VHLYRTKTITTCFLYATAFFKRFSPTPSAVNKIPPLLPGPLPQQLTSLNIQEQPWVGVAADLVTTLTATCQLLWT